MKELTASKAALEQELGRPVTLFAYPFGGPADFNRETQALVHFCAQHGIRPEITKISMSRVDDAWDKVVRRDARYRYVIDVATA